MKRFRKQGRLLVLLVSSMLAAGCGVKSAPLAPELVRPAQILDLRAASDPDGVKLTWERPIRYTGGHMMRDLSGFVIMRGQPGQSLAPLVELPVTDRERFSVQHEFNYIDNETVIGDRYAYEIVSKTADGYISAPSNEVAVTRVKPAPPPNPATYALPAPTPLPAP